MQGNVTTIAEEGFAGKSVSTVTIPNTITTIQARAFKGNHLTSLAIPSSVVTIGEEAFADTQITTVDIPSSVTAPARARSRAVNSFRLTFPLPLQRSSRVCSKTTNSPPL